MTATRTSCHQGNAYLDVWVQCTSPMGVDVDVSIGDDRGIRAARWLLRCQERWPAMRPLVLLLKAVLRVLELHDVSQGLSSTDHASNASNASSLTKVLLMVSRYCIILPQLNAFCNPPCFHADRYNCGEIRLQL